MLPSCDSPLPHDIRCRRTCTTRTDSPGWAYRGDRLQVVNYVQYRRQALPLPSPPRKSNDREANEHQRVPCGKSRRGSEARDVGMF